MTAEQKDCDKRPKHTGKTGAKMSEAAKVGKRRKHIGQTRAKMSEIIVETWKSAESCRTSGCQLTYEQMINVLLLYP